MCDICNGERNWILTDGKYSVQLKCPKCTRSSYIERPRDFDSNGYKEDSLDRYFRRERQEREYNAEVSSGMYDDITSNPFGFNDGW